MTPVEHWASKNGDDWGKTNHAVICNLRQFRMVSYLIASSGKIALEGDNDTEETLPRS